MQNFTKIIGLLLFLCLFAGVKTMAQQTDSISVRLADSIARYKQDSIIRAKGAKISSVVKDAATGKAISGISISVPQYSSAITNDKGQFTIAVPNYDILLVASGQVISKRKLPLKGERPCLIFFCLKITSILYTMKQRCHFTKVPVTVAIGLLFLSINTLGRMGCNQPGNPRFVLTGQRLPV
jgi:hypothetical protein